MVVCEAWTNDVPEGSADYIGIALVMEENHGTFSVITETSGEVNSIDAGTSEVLAMEKFLDICELEGLDA